MSRKLRNWYQNEVDERQRELIPNKRVVLMSENFYCNRIVDAWNSLSDTVVSAPLMNSFKRKLREVNLDRFLTIVE